MEIVVVSKFKSLFWIKISLGIIVFLLVLFYCIKIIVSDFNKNSIPILIGGIVVLLFILYVSLDVFKLFKLKITNSGMEKTTLLSNRKEFIAFNSITCFQREIVIPKNIRGQITDSYYVYILKTENRKLIISPSDFENYDEIVNSIKHNISSNKKPC